MQQLAHSQLNEDNTMKDFQQYHQTRSLGNTPAKREIPGRTDMVANSEGGYVFKTDPFTQLERFLILGITGGTFYVGERDLAKQNLKGIEDLINTSGLDVVQFVVYISTTGRAMSNDPALFVLAMCSAAKDVSVRRCALANLPQVARYGTDFFSFIEYAKHLRGRGRLFNKALKDWYLEKTSDKLAYQLVKYQQRNGWSHKDVLRLCKPSTDDISKDWALGWATGKMTYANGEFFKDGKHDTCDKFNLRSIEGFERCKEAVEEGHVRFCINEYGLTREMIPTKWLSNARVWEALLPNTPFNALVRNLGVMSSCGLLTPLSKASRYVAARLSDPNEVSRSRIHPMSIIKALLTYKMGHGVKGSLTWEVNTQIVTALEEAFYMSFENVEPTHKNILIGVDVSGSMGWENLGGIIGFTPAMASTIMAMVIARREPNHHIVCFSSGVSDLGITKHTSLAEACRITGSKTFGSTNIPAVIDYARTHKIDVDAYVVLTDNETYMGGHVCEKLKGDEKFITCAMEANEFTVADPNNANMLDIVGFDTATPQLISEFIK